MWMGRQRRRRRAASDHSGAVGISWRPGGAAITSIVLTAIISLALGIFSIATVFHAMKSGQPAAMGGVCVYVLPLALFILLLVRLIQAA